MILRFHICGPWSIEVPFIKIRTIGGEGYKNWKVGMWRKEGDYTTVLGMSSLTDLWDIQVHGGYRSLNTSGSWSAEDIRLFFGKEHNYELVCWRIIFMRKTFLNLCRLLKRIYKI